MSTTPKIQHFLDEARVDPEVFRLRSGYRALLITVDGIPPGPSDEASEPMLQEAEASAKAALAKQPVTEMPHIAAWREAYKAFGAKPNKTRGTGLPRVNRLTDIYNAISIKYQIPFGGEDLDKYSGAPFLVRAAGSERFAVKSGGEVVEEKPEKGEVVWCDGGGVTCRVWNWRQGPQTALDENSSRVLFILDALEPCSGAQLDAAAEELLTALARLSPDISVSRRFIDAASSS